nr:unnamed protein product [Digitaria exilis]
MCPSSTMFCRSALRRWKWNCGSDTSHQASREAATQPPHPDAKLLNAMKKSTSSLEVGRLARQDHHHGQQQPTNWQVK